MLPLESTTEPLPDQYPFNSSMEFTAAAGTEPAAISNPATSQDDSFVMYLTWISHAGRSGALPTTAPNNSIRPLQWGINQNPRQAGN